jgi:hypothetical protein
VAGISFLLYIAFGIPAMILMNRATHGEDIAARLAGVAQHAGDVRLAALFVLVGGFCAIALGVSLYTITRVQDPTLRCWPWCFASRRASSAASPPSGRSA